MKNSGKRKITGPAIAVVDAFLIAASFALALLIRFDFSADAIPNSFVKELLHTFPLAILITLPIFAFFRMYRYVWRMVGLHDVLLMAGSVIVTYTITQIILALLHLQTPVGISFIALCLQLLFLVGIRILPRVYTEMRTHSVRRRRGGDPRIMLIGGGAAGRTLIQEFSTSRQTSGSVLCVIDDNQNKWGKRIEGIPIIGGRDIIPDAVRQYGITLIVLAIPSISAQDKRSILQICSETDIPTKMLPGIYQLMNGQVRVSDIKDVQIEDLLGRESIRLDLHSLQSALGDKIILVTGGGGSIGSELCRQIACYNPRQLIILDIYENNAYDIQQELIQKYGSSLNLSMEIASVRDKSKIDELFAQYRPDIVFHAAAHKHVPLMENSTSEAIKNNIFGTFYVADAAERFGAKKFVMISTDKAVNPTNVMGASKRFCELIIQSRYDSRTEFCAVRFGNVLGSNGSVVPLFKRQISQGGPVTVTDKRITRFFMTIPEAVQLVLEAESMAQQSQIFVLDMGEPVRILDLAENLIRLSGFEPYQDIGIEEIGLRPGEKLYEELLMAGNDLRATGNKKIFVEQQSKIERETINANLKAFENALTLGADNEQLIALMKTMVPTYHSPTEVNETKKRAVCEAEMAATV